MSENNGDRRPDGQSADGENQVPYQASSADQVQWGQPTPNRAPGESQWGQHASSADQAHGGQWDQQATQSFGSGYQQDQPYQQQPYAPQHDTQAFQGADHQNTQSFQAEGQGYGYGQDAYTPQDTQAYGTQQYPAYGAPGAEGQSYGAYGQQAYGQPGYGQPGYGQQPVGGQPLYGGHDGGGYPPYGGYGQQPPKGKGPLIAWIVLGVLLIAAIVVGILFATGFFENDDEPTATQTETLTARPTTTTDPGTEPETSGGPQSVDPALTALYDECGAGDMAACDQLWFEADFGTEYYEFANTCGGTADKAYGTCESGSSSVSGESYGDDPVLDELYDKCGDGDLEACDELYFEADYDTDYYNFGVTCGDTASPSFGSCQYESPGGDSTYGTDETLDALWDSCEAGDFEACDDLWWDSPIDSEYEFFAGKCGDRGEYRSGMCVSRDEDGEF